MPGDRPGTWTVEVASLEDLLSLGDDELVVGFDEERHPYVEIYDDYRE
jgi:hypothetical protein